MSTNNSTHPNAIDLALDALREFEKFYDIACNDDRPVARELAAKNADFERSRSAILAHVAIAQALVAVAKELRTAGYTPAEKYAAALADLRS